MNNIINNLNLIYNNYINNKLLDKDIINLLSTYLKQKNINIKELLNNQEILFNKNNKTKLLLKVLNNFSYEILNNKILFSEVVKIIKQILNDYIILEYDEFKLKTYSSNNIIINNQINYLKIYINNLIPIEFNKHYENKQLNDMPENIKYSIHKNQFTKTKYFDNSYIIYSYICYFKCAVNCIKHNELFKLFNNIQSDKIGGNLINYPRKIIGGKIYNLNDYYMIGGYEIYDLIRNIEEDNLLKIIKTYNKLTYNYHMIGLIGIKYYPYQILNELLFRINNLYSDLFKIRGQYTLNISNYDLQQNKNNNLSNIIYNKLKFNTQLCAFINTTINDPFVNNVFTKLINDKITFDKIKLYNKNNVIKTINNNNIYQYDYIIGDYYLESICVIENLVNSGMDFHNVYIKFRYDNNWNVIEKIKYDNITINYNTFREDFKHNKKILNSIEKELNIFKDTYITDYYNGEYNYKISMVCYVNKNYNDMLFKLLK